MYVDFFFEFKLTNVKNEIVKKTLSLIFYHNFFFQRLTIYQCEIGRSNFYTNFDYKILAGSP